MPTLAVGMLVDVADKRGHGTRPMQNDEYRMMNKECRVMSASKWGSRNGRDPSFPRRRESRAARVGVAMMVQSCPGRWIPACAGDGGSLDSRLRGNDGGSLDSRLRGNDGGALLLPTNATVIGRPPLPTALCLLPSSPRLEYFANGVDLVSHYKTRNIVEFRTANRASKSCIIPDGVRRPVRRTEARSFPATARIALSVSVERERREGPFCNE